MRVFAFASVCYVVRVALPSVASRSTAEAEWHINDNLVAKAALEGGSTTYRVDESTTFTAGRYRCVVTNPVGVLISRPCEVEVAAPRFPPAIHGDVHTSGDVRFGHPVSLELNGA